MNNLEEHHIRRLETSFKGGQYGNSFELKLIEKSIKLLLKNLSGDEILEMGCGPGFTTELLAERAFNLTVIEGSTVFLEAAKERVGENQNITWQRCNWTDFSPENRFSDILFFRALEYIQNPLELIRKSKEWLTEKGKLHIVITNDDSLNRQIGRKAGMIGDEQEDDPAWQMGRLNRFNRSGIGELLDQAECTIIGEEGIGMKPLSNKQMAELPKNVQQAFLESGNLTIELAAEIYIIAQWK